MAEVRIKGYYMVKPCDPTWEGISSLSEWDQSEEITHIPTISFYKPSQQWLKSSTSVIDTLKVSLSRVLVHFYPLAGRVRWIGQGRLELVCNSMGVELFEAESSNQLSDFEDDFASNTLKYKKLIPFVDYDKPIDELPLVLGQLTMFRCGGVSLGVTISHVVADGQSAFHFLTEWARLARGEPLEATPYLDRKILIEVQVPPQKVMTSLHDEKADEFSRLPLLIGKDNDLEERKKATTVSILPLEREYVEALKKDANRDDTNGGKARPYSRYVVVTAHIWRSSCKARGHESEQLTCLSFCVDVRHRLHPPLPPKYFGNAILDVLVCAKAGDIMSRPLSYTCAKIREAIEKIDDEYVRSNIEFLRRQSDFSNQDLHGEKSSDGPFYGNPNIGVMSWLNLPMYGLDFGWGKEIYMGPGTYDSDGGCLMLPGPVNDGSVTIALCLQVAHINNFKTHFYEDINQS